MQDVQAKLLASQDRLSLLSWEALISATAAVGDGEGAAAAVKGLTNAGGHPTAAQFEVAILACCQSAAVDKAFWLVDAMLALSLVPTGETYRHIMSA